MAPLPKVSKRPADTAFQQQRLKAFQPILTLVRLLPRSALRAAPKET